MIATPDALDIGLPRFQPSTPQTRPNRVRRPRISEPVRLAKWGFGAIARVFNIASEKEAKAAIPDLHVVGDSDLWQLVCKASSQQGGWMKSTKAMEIPGLGCLVQVTSQHGTHVAESVTFVPGARVVDHKNGGRKLVLALPESVTAPAAH